MVLCCPFAAEDPSENYVKLRDYVLVKLCQGLSSFAADKLHLGFSTDMVQEAQDKLKINKVLSKGCSCGNSCLCKVSEILRKVHYCFIEPKIP